jgi:hypothetical protein
VILKNRNGGIQKIMNYGSGSMEESGILFTVSKLA